MKAAAIVLCVLATALTSVDCKKHTETAQVESTEAVQGDWVIKHELSDFQGLNPATTTDAEAQFFYNGHLYETLLYQDWETLEFIPWIADSLPAISADHLTYTFHLKKNVTFSDGVPLTAHDVVFTLKAIMNPMVINGAQLRNYFNMVVSAEAPDDYTFIVHMGAPYFLADHQIGSISIQPKHVLDPKGLTDKYTFEDCINLKLAKKNKALAEFADWFGGTETSKEVKNLIGSGPYVVKEWIANDRVIAERNPKYWNVGAKWGKAYPDKLVMKIVNDFNTALSALKAGELDIVTGLTPSLYTRELDITKSTNLAKDAFIFPYIYYIAWNEVNPIFADKRVRQAMTYFCDVKTLIDKVMLGLARPIFGMTFFMRKECHPSLKPYDFNPEKAKQLLKDAGWADTDGDGVLDKVIDGHKVDFRFTFTINSGNEIRKSVALIMSEELRKAGIIVDIQALEFSVFLQNLRNHKFDAYVGAWSVPTDAPDEYQIWHSSQSESHGSNYISFNNHEVDSCIVNNRIEFDEKKRIAYMQRFQEILYEEQPYTFLWNPKERAAYSNRFHNVHWFPIMPGYDEQSWWVPKTQQRYGVGKN